MTISNDWYHSIYSAMILFLGTKQKKKEKEKIPRERKERTKKKLVISERSFQFQEIFYPHSKC